MDHDAQPADESTQSSRVKNPAERLSAAREEEIHPPFRSAFC